MPSVLITGAARGIGKSIAMQMAALGWDVIAGVRTEQDGKAITATNPRRITPVLLDVTNAEHISALANSLPAQLNAIVNNAGIAVNGPVEGVPPTDVRRQFVFGRCCPIDLARVAPTSPHKTLQRSPPEQPRFNFGLLSATATTV